MTISRTINKQLAGREDLLLGSGTQTQTRGGVDVSISRINALSIPYYPNGSAVSTPVGTTLDRLDGIDGIDSLRALTPIGGETYWLNYHTTEGDGGGGKFRAYTGESAGTYTDDNGVTILPTGDGSAAWVREYSGPVNVRWFGAVGDGVTDDTTAIQAALDSELGRVLFPCGIYIVSSEIVVPDGSGIVGCGAHWNRRTNYLYSEDKQTVFKYTGSGGTNSCVIRLSNTPVGTEGTDFNDSGDGETDDLINITATDFHIDSNNLAEIGCYVYRAGNQTTIGNITCEKSKAYNHVHLGCYAAKFGAFGAYECEGHGVAIGWDIFSWNSVEATNFAYTATFLTANNGTANTYISGTATDLEESGGLFSVGRGSKVYITSEGNNGRACCLMQRNVTGGTNGPTFYVLEYLEGNADGPYVDYRTTNDAFYLIDGFLHPGNGVDLLPQNITIEAKSDAGTINPNDGPENQGNWLTIQRIHGDLSGSGFSIDSNTEKYKVLESSPFIQYTNNRPGAGSFTMALEGDSVAGSQGYSFRDGYYHKNGNLVFITGRITLSSLDVATSGRLLITGLPFRMASYTAHFGVANIEGWHNLTTPVIKLYGALSAGNSYIDLYKVVAASTSSLSSLTQSDISSTTLLQFSATYITDE